MFTDKIERPEDVDKLDPEYGDLLRRVLQIQADCEIGGPHLYIKDCLLNAPTDTDKLIVARTASEEIDHFRKMCKLANELGVDTTYLLKRSNMERYVEAFRDVISTWEDYAVFGFLVDRVGRFQLEEYVGGSYVPLDKLMGPMLLEEQGHISHGEEETRRMAQSEDEEQRKRIQARVNYWYPKALDMFGTSGSKRAERFMYWGLKRRHNAEARQQYIDEVNPLIESMGLQIPDEKEGRKYF
jgi:ring-1,2-phenylacetyl-CoA epoxidase subunit PaaA